MTKLCSRNELIMKVRTVWIILAALCATLVAEEGGQRQVCHADADQDCDAPSSPATTASCVKYDPSAPSVLIRYMAGRLGNHMFAYQTAISLRSLAGYRVYLTRITYEYLAKYFKGLDVGIMEKDLCGGEEAMREFT
jgi:hypothetical protein